MSLTAVLALISGMIGIMNSDLFTVRVVEVNDLPALSPLDAHEIIDIAKVPVETTNLFSLKMDGIRNRLLAQPWIKGVTISKRFPQTVSILVDFRKPVAIHQAATGALSYVDEDGKPFVSINLKADANLPLVVGFTPDQIPLALGMIRDWSKYKLDTDFILSSVEMSSDRRIRMMVTYPLKDRTGRTWVELGSGYGNDVEALLLRVREVMTYLSQNGIEARQVFADLGKKIVVRIARSS